MSLRRLLVLGLATFTILWNAKPESLGLGQDLTIRVSDPCPQTASDWESWKNRLIGAIGRNDGNAAIVELFLKKCPSPSAETAVQACLRPVHAWVTESNGGFTIPPEEYDRWESPDFPQMMKVPGVLQSPDLIRELSDFRTQPLAIKRLQAIPGAVVLNYTSDKVPSGDEAKTKGRILVYLPGKGGGYDQWFQFGALATPDDHQRGRNPTVLSLVAIQKKDGSGRDLPQTRVYFSDFQRTFDSSGAFTGYRREGASHSTTCWQCHSGGVNRIEPADSPLDSDREKSRVALNQKINAYGLPDWKNSFINAKHIHSAILPAGPEADALHDDAFFKSCTEGKLSPSSYPVIREAMRCTNCHNGSGQRTLTDKNLLTNAATYIKHGKMPKNVALTAEERTALWGCLFYDENANVWPVQKAESAREDVSEISQPHCQSIAQPPTRPTGLAPTVAPGDSGGDLPPASSPAESVPPPSD